ncbi:MAG: hypothetical protein J6V92_03665, partial [Bacteroidaceae bacterium]|nr:hypothetical protein [Bacteroidaceae bacterium]
YHFVSFWLAIPCISVVISIKNGLPHHFHHVSRLTALSLVLSFMPYHTQGTSLKEWYGNGVARREPCSLPCLPLLYGHPSMTAVGSEDGRKLEKQSGFPINFSLSHLLADGFIIGTALFRMSEKKAK